MFKYVLFVALFAFAAAKPLVVEYPATSIAYSAPVAVDYTAPYYYPGYATAYDYAAYSYPYSYEYFVR